MTALAILRGIGGALRPRVVLTLYAVNLLLALAVAVPHALLLDPVTSELPDPGLQAEHLRPPWSDDLAREHSAALGVLGQAAGAAGWLHVLAMTVLVGGVVRAHERRAAESRAEKGQAWSVRDLFADGAAHAGRMLRLLVVAMLFTFLAGFVFNRTLVDVHERYFSAISSERLSVLADWSREGLFLVVLFVLTTWLDLARVRVVVEGRRSSLAALVSAADGILRRGVPTLIVAATFLLAELGVMALGSAVLAGTPTRSWASIAAWTAAGQLLVLSRVALGSGRLAAFTSLVEDDVVEVESDAAAAVLAERAS